MICSLSSVDVSSVANFNNPYRELLVLSGVDNSIISLTNSVSFLASQFLMPLWSWVLCERLYPTKDLLKVFLRYGTEVFLNRFFEVDLIFGHLSSVS